jgi:Zn-dependent alcohol dehydrogenase
VLSALEPSISSTPFTSAIETTGQVSVIETSFSLLDNSGILALVGVSLAGEKISIDPMPLHYGREIKGVYGGNADPDLDIPILLDLMGSKEAKDSLRFYSSSLSEINKLIEHTKRADLEGRAIVLCQ